MPREISSQRIIELTRQLVAISSVVGTPGERELGDFLHGLLEGECSGIRGIELQRIGTSFSHAPPALMALWTSPAATPRTLVLMGHYDVVGLEPYGAWQELALDSEALRRAYAAAGDAELRSAAADPDWVFGRGWLDMKSGIAALIEVFLALASEAQLPANLLLLLTPDEESQSRGLFAALPVLDGLMQERGLELVQVVNADFHSPLFEDDDERRLYSGTIGKFTLGLSVFGTPTHAGETFGGVNSSALAGYLAYALEHDRRLLQGHRGEWLPPPTVLQISDNRCRYDVMTTDAAALYANVFNIRRDNDLMWRELKHELRRLLRLYDSDMRRRYNRFTARADIRPPRDTQRPLLLDFAELLASAANHLGREPGELLAEARARELPADERLAGLAVVEWLAGRLPRERAFVVASLLHPWYPARLEQDPERLSLLRGICSGQGLGHRHIYPYISDMSAFAWQDGRPGILDSQSPLVQRDAGDELLARINCPVLNLGPFGSGAHTGRERSRLGWLSEGLPAALLAVLRGLAG